MPEYENNGTVLVSWDNNVRGTLEVPETVKRIKSNAFKGCNELTSVVFCGDRVILDPNAFAGADNLEVVDLGEGDIAIGNGAFGTCRNLKRVIIRGGNKYSLAETAFARCETVEIHKGAKATGLPLFLNCEGVMGIVSPGWKMETEDLLRWGLIAHKAAVERYNRALIPTDIHRAQRNITLWTALRMVPMDRKGDKVVRLDVVDVFQDKMQAQTELCRWMSSEIYEIFDEEYEFTEEDKWDEVKFAIDEGTVKISLFMRGNGDDPDELIEEYGTVEGTVVLHSLINSDVFVTTRITSVIEGGSEYMVIGIFDSYDDALAYVPTTIDDETKNIVPHDSEVRKIVEYIDRNPSRISCYKITAKSVREIEG